MGTVSFLTGAPSMISNLQTMVLSSYSPIMVSLLMTCSSMFLSFIDTFLNSTFPVMQSLIPNLLWSSKTLRCSHSSMPTSILMLSLSFESTLARFKGFDTPNSRSHCKLRKLVFIVHRKMYFTEHSFPWYVSYDFSTFRNTNSNLFKGCVSFPGVQISFERVMN